MNKWINKLDEHYLFVNTFNLFYKLKGTNNWIVIDDIGDDVVTYYPTEYNGMVLLIKRDKKIIKRQQLDEQYTKADSQMDIELTIQSWTAEDNMMFQQLIKGWKLSWERPEDD